MHSDNIMTGQGGLMSSLVNKDERQRRHYRSNAGAGKDNLITLSHHYLEALDDLENNTDFYQNQANEHHTNMRAYQSQKNLIGLMHERENKFNKNDDYATRKYWDSVIKQEQAKIRQSLPLSNGYQVIRDQHINGTVGYLINNQSIEPMNQPIGSRLNVDRQECLLRKRLNDIFYREQRISRNQSELSKAYRQNRYGHSIDPTWGVGKTQTNESSTPNVRVNQSGGYILPHLNNKYNDLVQPAQYESPRNRFINLYNQGKRNFGSNNFPLNNQLKSYQEGTNQGVQELITSNVKDTNPFVQSEYFGIKFGNASTNQAPSNRNSFVIKKNCSNVMNSRPNT